MGAARGIFILCACVVVSCGCAGPPRRAYIDADARFRHAVRLRAAGKHAAAAQAFNRFASTFAFRDPRADYALYLSGKEFLAARRYRAALAAFDRLYEQFPLSPHLGRANASCLAAGKRLVEKGDSLGVEFLECVAYRSPDTPLAAEALGLLGDYYYRTGRFADAQAAFETVARHARQAPVAAAAELAAARAEYKQIDDPVRNMTHLLAARRRFRRLRSEEMSPDRKRQIEDYLNAIADLGAEAHLRMARFYLKQGEPGPALAHLREAVTEYPTSTRRKLLARSLLRMIETELGRDRK